MGSFPGMSLGSLLRCPNWVLKADAKIHRSLQEILVHKYAFDGCIHSNGFCFGSQTEKFQGRSSFIKGEQDKKE